MNLSSFWVRMNILLLGDEHTYGYGLLGGNLSYVGHLVQQLRRAGQDVSVEAYAHLTISQAASMLAQLPLSRYDLIVLQTGSQVLEPTRYDTPARAGFCMPILPYPGFTAKSDDSLGKSLIYTTKEVGKLVRYLLKPRQTRAFYHLLEQIRPYRHNTVLLTPLPHRQKIQQWLRNWVRALVLREADWQSFSVFDSGAILLPRDEYFLPNDAEHLNAISHELLGRSLFDFYQSAPTIITIQSPNRDQANY